MQRISPPEPSSQKQKTICISSGYNYIQITHRVWEDMAPRISRLVKLGLGVFLAGIVGGIGSDLWEAIKSTLVVSLFGLSIPFHWLIAGTIMGAGLVIVGYDRFRKPSPTYMRRNPPKRRIPWKVEVKEGSRFGFWVMMLMLIGFSFLMFQIGLTPQFPSTSPSLPGLVFGVSAGVAMLGIGMWFISGQIALTVEKRKEQRASDTKTEEKLLNELDGRLNALMRAPLPEIREKLARDLQNTLERLPPDEMMQWDDSLRRAINNLLDYIRVKFPDASLPEKVRYLNWLNLVFQRCDTKTGAVMKEKFANKEPSKGLSLDIQHYPELADTLNLVTLSQALRGFEEGFVTALADDAVLNWSDERFRNLWNAIRFDGLDGESFKRVRSHLLDLATDKSQSPRTNLRAYELWGSIKDL